MRLLANLFLFTLVSRVLGHLITRNPPGPDSLANNGGNQKPSSLILPASETHAYGILWTSNSIYSLPGVSLKLVIEAISDPAKKARKSTVPIYLIGENGVLLIGIPLDDFLSLQKIKYDRERLVLEKILTYNIVASKAVWRQEQHTGAVDPVKDINTQEWQKIDPRWDVSPLPGIKTVEQFLQESMQSIGNIINSGTVGFRKQSGMRASTTYQVTGEDILQKKLGIRSQLVSPLLLPSHRAPTQDVYFAIGVIETTEGRAVDITIGQNVVIKLPENGDPSYDRSHSVISQLGFRWPVAKKRPHLPDHGCPDETRPAPGAHNNARRSWSSNEDEGEDYDDEGEDFDDEGEDEDYDSNSDSIMDN